MPKKSKRLSPEDSSTKHEAGIRKIGNDGNTWEVQANKNGTHRWVRVKVVKDQSKPTIKSKRESPEDSETKHEVGFRQVGNDGKTWEVQADKNGRQRWVRIKEEGSCKQFQMFEKVDKWWFGLNQNKKLCGIVRRTGYIFPWLKYDTFGDEIPIPEGYKQLEAPPQSYIKRYKCSPKKKLPSTVTVREGKYYITRNNDHSYKLLVVVNKHSIQVYTRDDNDITNESFSMKGISTLRLLKWEKKTSFPVKFQAKLVYECHARKIWIGKSYVSPMTKYSGGYGKRFDGNTILVQISATRYVYIGGDIYSFESPQIINYLSPVGNNVAPYPFAETKNGYLFMLDKIWMKKTDVNVTEPWNVYGAFYDTFPKGTNKLRSIHRKMSNVKVIYTG
jgi:hypothetical protein